MQKRKTKVYVSIPSTGTIVDSIPFSLREIESTYRDHIEFIFPFNCVRRMFHDHARNKAVEDFLASDCDVIWFLDSDISPSIQVMDLIAIHWDKWKVAGLTYPVFMTLGGSPFPEVVYTVYERNLETGNFKPTKAPTEGSGFVDGLATGCLLIKRELLESMKAPWFEFKYKEYCRDIAEGEDLGFCRKIADMGHKFYVDFGTPFRHQKSIDLLDVNNYAMNFANRCIENYDAQIKSQITDAIKAAHLKGYQEGLAAKPKSSIITPGSPKWSLK